MMITIPLSSHDRTRPFELRYPWVDRRFMGSDLLFNFMTFPERYKMVTERFETVIKLSLRHARTTAFERKGAVMLWLRE